MYPANIPDCSTTEATVDEVQTVIEVTGSTLVGDKGYIGEAVQGRLARKGVTSVG
jgi:hypothetical protein